MADPTLERKYYSDASRRKSGSSNQKSAKDPARLGGEAYTQGYSSRSMLSKRGMLPTLGRNSNYKTTFTYRVDNGTDADRTIFAIEDFKSNNYFLDTDRLTKSRFLSSIEYITPTANNLVAFILPDGSLLKDESGEIKDTFFNDIKPTLDLTGYTDYYGNIPLPVKYHSIFNGYSTVRLKYTVPPRAIVTFPDGGITQSPDYSLGTTTYGSGREFSATTVFTELQKFDAIEFVKNNSPNGMFPETSKSPSYSIDQIYNGIIEPFSIRDRLYGKEILAVDDVKPGSLNGSITDPIEFSYSASETSKGAFAMLEDVAIVNSAEGYLQDIFVSETTYRPDAYEDRDPYDSVYVDEELENVLISMDATLNEGNLSVRHIDMTVGFDGMAKDRFGSIVYRGLMR